MRLIALITLTLAALLSGCAATVTRSTAAAAPAAASPAAGKKILMEVSAAPGIATGEDWDAFLDEWRTSMSAAASRQGASFTLAQSGAAPKSEPAVLVNMKVNDFKYVSQAKRYAVGVFSGNAFMDVDIELIEYPLGKSLGVRKFQTSSSAWQGVFSAMTPKQVEAVSNEIVGDIAGK